MYAAVCSSGSSADCELSALLILFFRYAFLTGVLRIFVPAGAVALLFNLNYDSINVYILLGL